MTAKVIQLGVERRLRALAAEAQRLAGVICDRDIIAKLVEYAAQIEAPGTDLRRSNNDVG
jgi:hypothetical protein